MNKGLFVFLLICLFLTGQSQQNLDNLFRQKDSLLILYNHHSDSITINSWLNIMQSNKFLHQISHLDSMIIQEISGIDQDSLISDFNRRINKCDTLIYNKNNQIAQLNQDNGFYKRMYFMLLIIGLLFLVIIVVLLLLTGRLNRLTREKERQLKTYHTNLFSANEEIERSRKTENQLASEINKLKKQIAERMEDSEDPELLKEEKLMLENQIIEIKKAYEMEYAKRMELESQLLEKDSQKDEKPECIDKEKVKRLKDQYEKLKAEHDNILLKLEQLSKAKNELQDELNVQTEASKVAEKRHADLVEKLKNLSDEL